MASRIHTVRLVVSLVTLLICAPAVAGTVSLAWDPNSDSDLAGYRVYYGTAPGNYPQNVDVGNVTSHTVTGLADCTTWYFAVKAYDTAGQESVNPSNEVSGWPKPVVSASAPSGAEQGRRLDVVINGSNFQAGATVDFLDPLVVVNAVTVNSCSQLTADVSIGGSATVGLHDIEVTNPDNIFGVGSSLFDVQATVPPSVSGATPADGATGVAVDVQPTVSFSEPMDPASISSTTVQLWDSTGQPVTHAGGSPSLSGDGLTATIIPAADLATDATYRVHVAGGATGVLDLAGHGMAVDFTQSTGFTTVAGATATTFRIEAEAGDLVAPVQTSGGGAAFQGAYIDTPSGTPTGSSTNPAGTATYGIEIPHDATWFVWVRVRGSSVNADGWFERMDGGGRQAFAPSALATWEWVEVRSYFLTAGPHDFELGGFEATARADRILITDDPNLVPDESPGADNTPPAPVSTFSATPQDGQNDLSWTNPADGDFVKTVIRYRTDGRYPTSPHDGLPVTEQAAAPGSADSFLHAGLTNGTTYSYSAFAVDGAGNVADAARVEATPSASNPPPDDVANLRRTDSK